MRSSSEPCRLRTMLIARPRRSAVPPSPAAAGLGDAALSALLRSLMSRPRALAASPPGARRRRQGNLDAAARGRAGGVTARAGLIARDQTAGSEHVGCASSSSWARLEPTRGDYAPAELARLDALVDDLHAAGVKVILTTCCLPGVGDPVVLVVASARRLRRGAAAVLPDPRRRPRATTATSASSSRAATTAECRRSSAGTSPTCGRSSIPSAPRATPTSPPASTCACSRRSTPAWRAPARACASSPAPPRPVGLNDIYRTSPQRFARFLRRARRRALLRRLLAPPVHARRVDLHRPGPAAQRPLAHRHALQPAHAAAPLPQQAVLPHRVRLQHAAQPRRSASYVSEQVQARYLRGRVPVRGPLPAGEAARVVPRCATVKPRLGPADVGVYTGLRRADGTRKPAWYAFRRL